MSETILYSMGLGLGALGIDLGGDLPADVLLDGRQAKLADIGQHWGITAERVRQIERLALAKMREYQAAA